MRIIRILGSIALWIGALLGIAAGGVWMAGQLGYIQPMVVISGSMEPGIMTGDLLIGRYTPTAQVELGDVVSVPSELTGKLVTHRVTSIDPLDADQAERFQIDLADGPRWELRMKGDANTEGDLQPYFPGDEVLTPWIQIPQGGKVVSKVMEPTVAMPILIALIALLGLSLLDEEPRKAVRRAVTRATKRDPRLEELDAELAAVGVDVERLRTMDDLDLDLLALDFAVEPAAEGDVAELDIDGPASEPTGAKPAPEPVYGGTTRHSRHGHGRTDGLWSHRLPASDGLGLVRTTTSDPPSRLSAPYDPLLPARVDELVPAPSG